MADYSLVPVDHQPDFGDYSLVPVDHDPFSGDDASRPAQFQPAQALSAQTQTQPQIQQAQFQQPQTQTQPAQLAPQTQPQQIAAGANDFFRSIPRGIVSGFNSAASALGRATQAEMGQDVDAPTPEQGMEILEKEVTGPMHRPEGRAGKFGASVGEFVGNPSSYFVPGSLPFKVGTAVLGGLGSEAGGQVAEGTPWEIPARIAGGLLGGVGATSRLAGASAKGAAPSVGLDSATRSTNAGEAGAIRVSRPVADRTLYHYTDEAGLNGILKEEKLNPSLKATNPNDVRYGNGQYVSDITPGTTKPSKLSQAFLGFPWQERKFTHYVEIDPGGLNVVKGREGVYVIPNEEPLDLNDRIVSSGKVPSGWFTSR